MYNWLVDMSCSRTTYTKSRIRIQFALWDIK